MCEQFSALVSEKSRYKYVDYNFKNCFLLLLYYLFEIYTDYGIYIILILQGLLSVQ